MSENAFDDYDTNNDNPVDIALKESLNILVNALVDDKNTNISKRELKSISILKQNPYIWNIIKDYVPNKRYVNANFEKSLQKVISNISNAIAMRNNIDMEHKGILSRLFRR